MKLPNVDSVEGMVNDTKVSNMLSTVFLSMKWHRIEFVF